MKKFLLKSILFLLPIAVVFFSMDRIVTQGLKKSNYRDFAEWNDLFAGRINADILISGSSVAKVQISPKIIENNTKCDTYNLGMDGQVFQIQYNRYLNYKEYNKKPKVIIQTLDVGSLRKTKSLYNYQQFLPYLDKKPVYDATSSYKEISQINREVPFHKYLGEFDLILAGVSEYFNLKKFSNGNYKGYEGQNQTWNGQKFEAIKKSQKMLKIENDAESMQLFEEFLQYCKSEKIELILVYTPIYAESPSVIENINEIKATYKKFAEKYNATLLDHSDSYLSGEKKYFYNATHLNKEGSELFTNLLIEDIARNYESLECGKN